MGMRMKEINYNAPAKQILATPEHYVAIGFNHPQATALATGNAVLENGRYIVKAGTIYPANDATAKGIVLNDYDVTDGDAQMAVVVHGFIKTAVLPVEPDALAVGALKQINFIRAVASSPVIPPVVPPVVPVSYILTNAELVEAAANDGTLENGVVGIVMDADAIFKDTIAKADIVISNLPEGMDYDVSYVADASIAVIITGTAKDNEAKDSVELEVTIKKEAIETVDADLQIKGITITFKD